jgi:hypothetical protein
MLKADLAKRMRVGATIDSVTAGSPFSLLAEAWLADLRMDVDRADSTKELYERELPTLVLATFEHFPVREVTVGRVETGAWPRARAGQGRTARCAS